MCRREVFAMFAAFMASAQAFAGGTIEPVRAQELERLVRHDCGSCHGMTLKGGLGPDIRAQRLAGASVEALTEIILNGVANTPMPPWRSLLSEKEARWVAEYLLREGAQ
jgi:cytochrome c55X